jgi:hypothetical protein
MIIRFAVMTWSYHVKTTNKMTTNANSMTANDNK